MLFHFPLDASERTCRLTFLVLASTVMQEMRTNDGAEALLLFLFPKNQFEELLQPTLLSYTHFAIFT